MRGSSFGLLRLQKLLQHVSESFDRQWLRNVVVGAFGARPFLVGIALAVGDVEQRGAGEVLADLLEQPAAIVFFDRLIVEYNESHIWLSEHLAAHVFVGCMADQLPRTLNDSEYELRQRLVIREEQHSGRETSLLRSLGFHLLRHVLCLVFMKKHCSGSSAQSLQQICQRYRPL